MLENSAFLSLLTLISNEDSTGGDLQATALLDDGQVKSNCLRKPGRWSKIRVGQIFLY